MLVLRLPFPHTNTPLFSKFLQALMDMFYQDDEGGANSLSEPPIVPTAAPRTSLTYEEVVRELMTSERQYLRDLHMIIKVFREEIIKLKADQKELDVIFSNILDIYELTVTLLGSLEDVMEMAQEQMPYIGSCFEGKCKINLILKYYNIFSALRIG